MAQQELSALKAAAIDGRGRNIFYRQTQVEKLHGVLVLESSAIQDAIVSDTSRPATEARLEFSLALRFLRDRYAELDATREIEMEYRIAKGSNAGDARVPYGVAIIRPSGHTLFYSTITALCAALAAGNCTIIQV
jgi:acyl-CoA reductase-like NAD-dependent aldehyde dehydrogenase